MTVVLTADCVAKGFGNSRVLTSASLRAVAGEFRVLLGRNGAGKSTLLKIAVGIISPDSGVVQLDGVSLSSPSLAVLARCGVFYWPDLNLMSSAFTVRAQLLMFQRQFCGANIDEVAEQVQITDLLDSEPHSLSCGERRRAELAAVLVRRPRCLLADEPCRGLDPIDTERMLERLRTLAHSGAAVVVTGHGASMLLPAADHVTWCTSGTTHELGAPHAAVRHDGFRREYLGIGAPGAGRHHLAVAMKCHRGLVTEGQ